MSKNDNRSASTLRKSLEVARRKIREEWLELKGPMDENEPVVTRKRGITKNNKSSQKAKSKPKERAIPQTSNVLNGIVALVEVGPETRALPLRAALSALGASVVPTWSPLITHLIWTEGGCRAVRGKALALASRLVSPLWVEACAATGLRLPERCFPAAARPSDPLSPATLRNLLRRAEQENLPLGDIFDNSDDKQEPLRLRISNESESEKDASKSSANDTSNNKIDEAVRVNTALRRALPASMTPSPGPGQAGPGQVGLGQVGPVTQPGQVPAKSRRKLFTQREVADDSESDEDSSDAAAHKHRPRARFGGTPRFLTKATVRDTRAKRGGPLYGKRVRSDESLWQSPRDRRQLQNAESLARRLVAEARMTPASRHLTASRPTPARRDPAEPVYNIVLTGMSWSERTLVRQAVKKLGGRVKTAVGRHTTHVLLGSCQADRSAENLDPEMAGIMAEMGHPVGTQFDGYITGVECIGGGGTAAVIDLTGNEVTGENRPADIPLTGARSGWSVPRRDTGRMNTLKALEGAARGCHVLFGQWALDSAAANRWLFAHHYYVPHLRGLAESARAARLVGHQLPNEGYDIFFKKRVHVTENAEKRDMAIHLLKLCGATLLDVTGGSVTSPGPDVIVGSDVGQVMSKWVFDCVAAGRIRNTRRYVVK